MFPDAVHDLCNPDGLVNRPDVVGNDKTRVIRECRHGTILTPRHDVNPSLALFFSGTGIISTAN